MRNIVVLLSIIILSLQTLSHSMRLNKDKIQNSLRTENENEVNHRTSSNLNTKSSACTMVEGKCVPAPSYLNE
jgi:hypothetical protein